MRKNPTISKVSGPLEGLDGAQIAFPMGIHPGVMDMPSVDMSTNDGSNPSIPDAPFANGSDNRNRQGGSDSPAEPGKG